METKPFRPALSMLILFAVIPLCGKGVRGQVVEEFQAQYGPRPAPRQEQSSQAPGAKAQPPTAGFDVPKPSIITQPNFKPQRSYGITTESDGAPLTDHKIYAIDTAFFIKKTRDGIARKGEDAGLQELLKSLEKAAFSYDQAEGTINYEEQITFGKPIRLEDIPTPRGKELRTQMKAAITKMSEIRQRITAQYGAHLRAGRLTEEQ